MFAASVLALGGLAACGQAGPAVAPSPAPPEPLIFYDWEGDMPASVLEAFTQETGVAVKYLEYESQEEAMANMRAGEVYDVVVMESRFVPLLVEDDLLAALDHRNIRHLRNIAPNFRELAYDPGNQYSVPYNWGTTGLVVRSDLVAEPVRRWADLWDARYAGRVGVWFGQQREVIGLTLKSLGFSANTVRAEELQLALERLIALKPGLLALEDYDLVSSADVLASGQAVITMGYAGDVLAGREQNSAITYILPEEGALLWSDTFIIPANSSNRRTAEAFLDFLLRPEINAQIANENLYATANEAARQLIDPLLLNDPVIFPPNALLRNAELILPLDSAGQALHDAIWARFLEAAE